MSYLEKISFDELLGDISPEKPAGTDLRNIKDPFSSLYYSLKDLRSNARSREKQNASEGEIHFIKSSDWLSILDKSYELLTKHSKDIEVSTWFVEALVRLLSFEGAAYGLRIVTALIQKYCLPHRHQSDILHESEHLNLDFIAGLCGSSSHEGTLVTPLRCAPLTQNQLFSLWQLNQAHDLERTQDSELKLEKKNQGFVELKKIKADIQDSSSAFLRKTKNELENSIVSLDELTRVINTNFPMNDIAFNNIKNILCECQRNFLFIAEEKFSLLLNETKNLQTANDTEIGDQENDEARIPLCSFSLENPYADIMKLLKNIDLECVTHPYKYNGPLLKYHTVKLIHYLSELLKVTDGLSPLPYFLERAVYVSKLSFAEALNELNLSPREISHDTFVQLTGINLSAKKED